MAEARLSEAELWRLLEPALDTFSRQRVIPPDLAMTLIRAAYGQGYTDAFCDHEPDHAKAFVNAETAMLRLPI